MNYLTVEKNGYEPVITLPDASADTIEQGSTFDPAKDVTAKDYAGNDITDRITIAGTVDTSVPGIYELTYTVTDENGNTAVMKRTVQVTGKETEDPGQTPGGDQGQTPGGDQSQTPGGDQGQTPDGTGSDQGFQNVVSKDEPGNTASGLHGNRSENSGQWNRSGRTFPGRNACRGCSDRGSGKEKSGRAV